MNTAPTYNIGDIVTYTPHLGGNVRVRVLARDPEIRNGQPGFDAEVYGGPADGKPMWGYDRQITAVEPNPFPPLAAA